MCSPLCCMIYVSYRIRRIPIQSAVYINLYVHQHRGRSSYARSIIIQSGVLLYIIMHVHVLLSTVIVSSAALNNPVKYILRSTSSIIYPEYEVFDISRISVLVAASIYIISCRTRRPRLSRLCWNLAVGTSHIIIQFLFNDSFGSCAKQRSEANTATQKQPLTIFITQQYLYLCTE